MDTTDFGRWLQSQLDVRRWSQADFVRRSGVGKTSVSSWIAGHKLPDAQSCDKIAEALFLDRDEVLARAGLRPVEYDDSDVVREFTALLRRIEWNQDRYEFVRSLLTDLAARSISRE